MLKLKRCCVCKVSKPLEEFCNNRCRHDNKQTYCRPCGYTTLRKKYYSSEKRREQHLKEKYKISNNIYDDLLKLQNNLCAICKTGQPGGKYNTFFIDHCHKTNEIRGLLCYGCNIGLGHFKDNMTLLENAIEYLKTSKNYKDSFMGVS